MKSKKDDKTRGIYQVSSRGEVGKFSHFFFFKAQTLINNPQNVCFGYQGLFHDTIFFFFNALLKEVVHHRQLKDFATCTTVAVVMPLLLLPLWCKK